MQFDEKTFVDRFPRKVGYFLMYLIFTVVLYFILKILDKLPLDWTVFHVVGITLAIVLFGRLIKLLLK
ncbi:MAG: hypothetical protein AABY16_01915 [Nanoarchaeota archaeon]